MNNKKRVLYRVKSRNKGNLPILCVWKTCKHFYAQLFDADMKNVILSVSSVAYDEIKGYNASGVMFLSKLLAKKMLENNIKEYVYNRSGFRYIGNIALFGENLKKEMSNGK